MTTISCNPFYDNRMFFFATKLFFFAVVTKMRLEPLPRDVFLWFANFL